VAGVIATGTSTDPTRGLAISVTDNADGFSWRTQLQSINGHWSIPLPQSVLQRDANYSLQVSSGAVDTSSPFKVDNTIGPPPQGHSIVIDSIAGDFHISPGESAPSVVGHETGLSGTHGQLRIDGLNFDAVQNFTFGNDGTFNVTIPDLGAPGIYSADIFSFADPFAGTNHVFTVDGTPLPPTHYQSHSPSTQLPAMTSSRKMSAFRES
jgi:hypothetical protein